MQQFDLQNLTVPGVYHQDILLPASPELLTGVPVFLGVALSKDSQWQSLKPRMLQLWTQFEQYFDSSEGFLSHAVRGFFENGGRLCFVVALEDNTIAELERGLEAIEAMDTIDLVCAPDVVSSPEDTLAMQIAVLEHCDRTGDRFAILDRSNNSSDDIQRLQGNNGALYAPWLKVENVDGYIPPCGHIAGVYARCDRNLPLIQTKLDNSSATEPNFNIFTNIENVSQESSIVLEQHKSDRNDLDSISFPEQLLDNEQRSPADSTHSNLPLIESEATATSIAQSERDLIIVRAKLENSPVSQPNSKKDIYAKDVEQTNKQVSEVLEQQEYKTLTSSQQLELTEELKLQAINHTEDAVNSNLPLIQNTVNTTATNNSDRNLPLIQTKLDNSSAIESDNRQTSYQTESASLRANADIRTQNIQFRQSYQNLDSEVVQIVVKPQTLSSNSAEQILLPSITKSQEKSLSKRQTPIVQIAADFLSHQSQPLVFANSAIAKNVRSAIKTKTIKDREIAKSLASLQEIADKNAPKQSTTVSNYSTNVSSSSNEPTQIDSPEAAIPPPQVDLNALVDKVERKLMRRLVIESERRGKKRWR